jgi:hypothetical protein
MSKITNASFVPGNTVVLGTVNSKFTDVQTATQDLNAENFRSESIDLFHLAADASMVKATKRHDSGLLSYERTYDSQNSAQVVQQNGPAAFRLDMGSTISYAAYDIIRLYWSVEVTAQALASTDSVYTNNRPKGGLFWGIYPVWGTTVGALTPPPGQGALAAGTIASQAANYLNTDATLGFMPIPHVLQYNEIVDDQTNYEINYRYPETGQRYSTSSAWFFKPTTSGSYRYIELRLHGLLTGWNDGAGNSYVSDYYANIFNQGATKASITLRRIYMGIVHLRGS